jgi:hypothetical protein
MIGEEELQKIRNPIEFFKQITRDQNVFLSDKSWNKIQSSKDPDAECVRISEWKELPILKSQDNKPKIITQYRRKKYKLIRIEDFLRVPRIGPSPGPGQGSARLLLRCIYAYIGEALFTIHEMEIVLQAEFECNDKSGFTWRESVIKELKVPSPPIEGPSIPYMLKRGMATPKKERIVVAGSEKILCPETIYE